MASIRRFNRSDGTPFWSVLYRHDGKQRSVSYNDADEAHRLRDLINQFGVDTALRVEQITETTGRGITVTEWIDHHIDHLTGVEQYTLDKYRAYLKNDIAPTIGKLPLAALTQEDIANWVKMLELTGGRGKRGQSPKTIKNKHGFLSAALAAAVPKHIAANPAAGRRLPRGDGQEADDEIRMLSHEEFALLLSKVTPPWRPLVEFLVASGCRWGEAVALKPSDVDRSAGTVRIRRAWKYSSSGYTIGPPKTKRSRRTIDVDQGLLEKLDYTGEWLFLNRMGGPVRYQGFRRRVWDKAVERSKLDPKPTPHDLRHTCASWMLNGGVPPMTVSRHLGHESIQVTVDIYGDVDRTSSRVASEVIAMALNR